MVSNAKTQNITRHESIDLTGIWHFSFTGSDFNDFVFLPGTTDTNKRGNKLNKFDDTMHLSRNYSYVGKVYYQREIGIPEEWGDADIYLHLERSKPSTVFIDGKEIGSNDNISTEQVFYLGKSLKSGRHTLLVIVDNSSGVPKQLYVNSHAYCEDTQTNWNGVIGKLYLEAIPRGGFSQMILHPDAVKKTIEVELYFNGKVKPGAKIDLRAIATPSFAGDLSIVNLQTTVDAQASLINNGAPLKIEMPFNKTSLWSEFHPDCYTVEASIDGGDEIEETTGFVDFNAKGHHFYVNNHVTFLRGKHDACVFPLIGHTPMDKASWENYFTIMRNYGINHIRFHSWCPPEACFAAADEMGFYLQPELPFWGNFDAKDTVLMTFLKKEGENIIRAYGHHPSFVMMSLGNELWGETSDMKGMVDDFRAIDPTKLYTFGSNFHLGYAGYVKGIDYFTTARNGGEKYGDFNTHVRGSFSFADVADGGIINHEYPNTSRNFDAAIDTCSVPIISHETGQFQIYPLYSQIKKYTGVLRPCNLEVFKSRLEKAGMGEEAKIFSMASGAWTKELYKADIEMDLRSRNMAGFHLLDLVDYPGQGSAYVGMLDAFMDSKNIVSPAEWRQWCSPVVPLIEMDTLCYDYGITDSIKAKIEVANYSEGSLNNHILSWDISNSLGTKLIQGQIPINSETCGLSYLGEIAFPENLIRTNTNQKLDINVFISGTNYCNKSSFWLYGDAPKMGETANDYAKIIQADTLTELLLSKIKNGASVLLFPKDTTNTVGGLFTTDYWNYGMFKTISENNKRPTSPGTLGLLIDNTNAIFRNFPTENHTSWQWFSIVKASHPEILDNVEYPYPPIVQVIDNIERNHKLALVYEYAYGKGKVLVCRSDLRKLNKYPEARALYSCILRYMDSKDFAPKYSLSSPINKGND